MKEFDYVVKDVLGLHARPAGMLAMRTKNYKETMITVTKGNSTVIASQLMKLMTLNVKCGDTVTVTAEGPEEDAAIRDLKEFFEKNL